MIILKYLTWGFVKVQYLPFGSLGDSAYNKHDFFYMNLHERPWLISQDIAFKHTSHSSAGQGRENHTNIDFLKRSKFSTLWTKLKF
jgi:hypothetical protein